MPYLESDLADGARWIDFRLRIEGSTAAACAPDSVTIASKETQPWNEPPTLTVTFVRP